MPAISRLIIESTESSNSFVLYKQFFLYDEDLYAYSNVSLQSVHVVLYKFVPVYKKPISWKIKKLHLKLYDYAYQIRFFFSCL